MKDKFKVFLTLAIVMAGIYFIATKLTDIRDEDIEFINKDYKYSKAVVIKKSVYKGHSIKVKYMVEGKVYTGSDGIDAGNKIKEGDSVDIKFSTTKPELMITEFNEQFKK
jgi:ribosomal 50S subunit-recycling heat shock protein